MSASGVEASPFTPFVRGAASSGDPAGSTPGTSPSVAGGGGAVTMEGVLVGGRCSMAVMLSDDGLLDARGAAALKKKKQINSLPLSDLVQTICSNVSG